MEEKSTNPNNSHRLFEELKKSLMKHHLISEDVSEKFSQLIWENPEKALKGLIEWYNNSLNKAYTDSNTGENYRYFVESIAGGPHEAIPSALYNCIGEIYPFLDRDIKNKSLGSILSILDFENSENVQISHTYNIREPLLLADISIVRPIYWPGMDEGANLIKKYNNLFCDFKNEVIDDNGFFNKRAVHSDFIVAYSILRNDFCNWGKDYLKVVNPTFLERVLQGIVGMRFAFDFRLKNLSDEEKKGINYKAEDLNFCSKNEKKINETIENNILEGKNRLKQLLPLQVHNSINEKINKKEWVDPFLFLEHKDYILKRVIEDRYLNQQE
jgi:hypothetical protein